MTSWKEALLMSNMPLEFEAARLLASQGFAVNSDYRYAWNDDEALRDAAVDLHAKGRLSSDDGEASAVMELLIDCHHRSPKTIGLFLPDPNPAQAPAVSAAGTLRIIDQFSPYVVASEAVGEFDAEAPVCYKGIEIETGTGEVNETAYRHGLWRLQNPLPRLLIENIFAYLTGPTEENRPFLFCPVLLTTASLYVLKKETTLEEIEKAENVEEVGEKTPWLIMQSDLSPDFRSRCMSESKRLAPLLRTEPAMEIEMKKARHYNSRFNLPFTIIDALSAADYYYLKSYFTRFIICAHDRFPELLNRLVDVSESSLETRIALT